MSPAGITINIGAAPHHQNLGAHACILRLASSSGPSNVPSPNASILAKLTEGTDSSLDLHVLPNIDRHIDVRLSDRRRNGGLPLREWTAFCSCGRPTAKSTVLSGGPDSWHFGNKVLEFEIATRHCEVRA